VVTISMHYRGGLHCDARHGPSNARLETDAPRDNQGQGAAFSPTDLVATALGTCVLTTMGIVANRNGWQIDGLDLQVDKHMTLEGPRRIARLEVRVGVPAQVRSSLDNEARHALEQAAHGCPVRISLLPAIEVPIDFGW